MFLMLGKKVFRVKGTEVFARRMRDLELMIFYGEKRKHEFERDGTYVLCGSFWFSDNSRREDEFLKGKSVFKKVKNFILIFKILPTLI